MPAKEKTSPQVKPRKKRASKPSASASLPKFGDYGTGILEQRLKKLLAHAGGAKSGSDTEAIHQMRVWSRRSRAALDVFGGCFTGHAADALACMEREVKNVTRALGEARDLDVMMDTLRARAETLPPEQQAGVDSFIAHLHTQRDERQQAVTRAVERLEKQRLDRVLRRAARHKGYKAVTLAAPDADDAHAPTGLTVSIRALDGAVGGHEPASSPLHETLGEQSNGQPVQLPDKMVNNGHKNSERDHHG